MDNQIFDPDEQRPKAWAQPTDGLPAAHADTGAQPGSPSQEVAAQIPHEGPQGGSGALEQLPPEARLQALRAWVARAHKVDTAERVHVALQDFLRLTQETSATSTPVLERVTYTPPGPAGNLHDVLPTWVAEATQACTGQRTCGDQPSASAALANVADKSALSLLESLSRGHPYPCSSPSDYAWLCPPSGWDATLSFPDDETHGPSNPQRAPQASHPAQDRGAQTAADPIDDSSLPTKNPDPMLSTLAPSTPVATVSLAPAPGTTASPRPGGPGTQENPFWAKLVYKEQLSKPGSPKDTWHLELDVSGSPISYQCGDSLGVYASQDPVHVAAVLAGWQLDPQATVTVPRRLLTTTLHEALLRHVSLGHPTLKLLRWLLGYVPPARHRELPRLLQEALPHETADPDPNAYRADYLTAYLEGRTLLDLSAELPCRGLPPQEFVAHLRPLQPRLYSIASTPVAHPQRIALTVEVEHHTSPTGRTTLGAATGFLTARAPLNEAAVPVFVTHSHFRLPSDPHADIILIGPGTGIAPYMGFLHERELLRAPGRNWLFFGNPHRTQDFLYQERLEHWQRTGHLHELSLAFSRDQEEKVYVQHHLQARAGTVWAWLQGGAHLYVCGDAKHMAKAVEATLLILFQTHGHLDAPGAKAYLQTLKHQGRYQRDVY